jgi:hypothetical protein
MGCAKVGYLSDIYSNLFNPFYAKNSGIGIDYQ